jgi:4a-hydroxytetrahydrobiopterin dehydratase
MPTATTTLSPEELNVFLARYMDWSLHDGKLVRGFVFDDFKASMVFVNRVAELAEEANHHPDIDIRYNTVELALVSHDAGGITARDVRMASLLSEAFPA